MHSLDQPMNAYQSGIGGVEASYITQSPLLGLLALRIFCAAGAATAEKVQERFVGCAFVHFFQNVIDLREKNAGAETILRNTPVLTLNFGDSYVGLLKRLQNLGR